MALPLLDWSGMPASRRLLLMDQLEDLDEGLAIDDPDQPASTPTLLGRVALHDGLDQGLAHEAGDVALTASESMFLSPEEFGVPGSPAPLEAPPVKFLVLMALVGATVAMLAFHRQVALLF